MLSRSIKTFSSACLRTKPMPITKAKVPHFPSQAVSYTITNNSSTTTSTTIKSPNSSQKKFLITNTGIKKKHPNMSQTLIISNKTSANKFQSIIPIHKLTSSISTPTITTIFLTAPKLFHSTTLLAALPFNNPFSSSKRMPKTNPTDQPPNTVELGPDSKPIITKTEEEWQEQLSPEEFLVLREADTQPQYLGYTSYFEPGTYACKGCDTDLYPSGSKFQGCGWPSFDDCIPGTVSTRTDADGRRVEILCTKCHGHLGHVFTGEEFTPKNIRHCVNSCSLVFKPSSPAPTADAEIQKEDGNQEKK